MLSRDLAPPDLRENRIWLSGSVPEPETWGDQPVDRNVQEFVRVFAALVFKYNGRLIHGCHPSITPVLVQQAKRYLQATLGCGASPLTLATSEYFDQPQNVADWRRWNAVAEVEVTPAATKKDESTNEEKRDLDLSLAKLRNQIAYEADAFVAIGGKWWDDQPDKAGIPKEFALAQARSLPCFILGGFGGISSRFADENPEWCRLLNNQLPDDVNQQLANATDFSMVAGMVVNQLAKLVNASTPESGD